MDHAATAPPKAHYKEYFFIFGALFVLTILEVLAVKLPIAKGLIWSALILMAVAKAALVGLFYMHLKHETNILKLTVVIPLMLPGVYALVLIAEAAWRLANGGVGG